VLTPDQRETLYRLIDELPESAWPAAAHLLETLRASPADDDGDEDTAPLSAAAETMLAESRAAYARGEYLTSAELEARLAQIQAEAGPE